ncbi:UDP-glucose:glyco protein glucosyltransferase [Basidiobolus meristosporus CBS 931.73]|uniref:UDP-glucose:glyco protein glucosyltransferase n=1 Tax=Basidiobolus meristosporus CBS 931.73 TaxID=1314790 RepID=A0A1Y1Y580_9FUNG|nr:UDP-glucose:glyco protein glucosyltransferase [Basidiobolus meristosporus CBS 931.73]|eukprot:ORX93045.1 UDP-glucose:glyco protein glucosyltransferase [Basidiobolus meristosporus CBS 931.73]
MVSFKFSALLSVVYLSSAAVADTPPVKTWLQTSWGAPDVALEILEYVSKQNGTAFFPLLDAITKSDISEKSQAVKYNSILSLIEKQELLSPPFTGPLLKLSLAVHDTAPAVQAYYHYYNVSVIPEHMERDSSFDVTCSVWADWYGEQICDVEKLRSRVSKYSASTVNPTSKLLVFDHIQNPDGVDLKETPMVILYANPLSEKFKEFHDYLYELSEQALLSYVLRYKPTDKKVDPLYLSGYGVELALKNTEYMVVDDRKVDHDEKDDAQARSTILHGEEGSSNAEVDKLDEEIPEIKALRSGQIKSLGIKTMQYILQSQQPLRILRQISQNFPKYAHILAQQPTNTTFEREMNNPSGVSPGTNLININGLPVDTTQINPFSLVKLLRTEASIIAALESFSINPRQAIELLSSAHLSASGDNAVFQDIFDVRASDQAITWWNDLEKDRRYSNWPKGMFSLLSPVYPGQMRYIRKNIFSALFALDLSVKEHLNLVVNDISEFIRQEVPVRFGIVPIVDQSDSNASLMAKSFEYFLTEYGRIPAMTFLKTVYEKLGQPSGEFNRVIQDSFESTVASSKIKNPEAPTTFEAFLHDQKYDEILAEIRDFSTRFNFTPGKNAGMFLNGKYFDVEQGYQRNLIETYRIHVEYLQMAVYRREITDETNVYEHFLTLPSAYPRRNPILFVSDKQPLDMIGLDSLTQHTDQLFDTILYVSDAQPQPVSLWLISDFTTEEGAKLGLEALKSYGESPDFRVAFIHKGSGHAQGDASLILYNALANGGENQIAELKSLFENIVAHEPLDSRIQALEELKPVAAAHWDQYKRFLNNAIKPHQGVGSIIINGRIINSIPSVKQLSADDIAFLVKYERRERVDPLLAALKELNLVTITDSPDSIMKICFVVNQSPMLHASQDGFENKPAVRSRLNFDHQSPEKLITVGDQDKAIFDIQGVLDPLSEDAQKWTSVLEALAELDIVRIQILLNPVRNLEKLPIKRFYRYVFQHEPRFDPETGNLIAPLARFNGLPSDPLLTLGMDTISPWLVTPIASIHDLDNIRLADLDDRNKRGVEATFQLKHILVEGHCRDMTTNAPPRGLQLVLGTTSFPSLVDTIVMANLGYLQLKANPGVWKLSLRDGRSKELYHLESSGSQGWYSGTVEEIGNEVVLNNFEGVVIFPRVRKNSGMENQELDQESAKENEKAGFWASLKSKIFKEKSNEAPEASKEIQKRQAEINVFSVASGHLYERFLSIMILSVLKNTESTVKFWFIENFLSPSFKDFLPHMAKEHNFDYELVTYKWPHWLRGQTEKQRTIWGYKILFLDVLFPLDLNKVIFVDADQVVRADLKELVDMDLHGAPYGYTPFCDDRPEIDGFRFWKHGYWQNHLQGKPYHISALYVIDLNRFRQMAAGDRLRGQYHALSADPNSLANLDQDLPNNMQHEVPIHSLPVEWLWCETWCSDGSLKKAKTIDLCNNPMTKEPKLERAKRLLPEWEGYDEEVHQLVKRLNSDKRSAKESATVIQSATVAAPEIKDEL